MFMKLLVKRESPTRVLLKLDGDAELMSAIAEQGEIKATDILEKKVRLPRTGEESLVVYDAPLPNDAISSWVKTLKQNISDKIVQFKSREWTITVEEEL